VKRAELALRSKVSQRGIVDFAQVNAQPTLILQQRQGQIPVNAYMAPSMRNSRRQYKKKSSNPT
jgi:hypothetical protein